MRLGVLLLLASIGVAEAASPDISVRPSWRGTAASEAAVATDGVRLVRVTESRQAPARSVRPLVRKFRIVRKAETPQIETANAVRLLPGQASVRPKVRPKVVFRKAKPEGRTKRAGLFKRKEPKVSAKGSVCGVPEIKGSKIAAIPGRIRGCGVAEPVAITSVSGVGLTSTAKIDCTTAKALNTWVKSSVKPAVGKLGGGVSSLKVAAHYACRTRNNRKGAKISEHGKGRAIDISAINLKNGQSITVLKGWRRAVEGKILKRIHKDACGPFGTVLGPNADRYHQDHFHFDTARYRSGSYCR